MIIKLETIKKIIVLLKKLLKIIRVNIIYSNLNKFMLILRI